MKIAINSLPRAGTKVLQANFHRYLKAAKYNILCPLGEESIVEPFLFSDNEHDLQVTKTTIGVIDNWQINWEKKYIRPTPISVEIQNRFERLESMPQSWVYKVSPWSKFDPILYESASRLDKSVAVLRHDIFDHAISYAFARQIKIWQPGEQMNEALQIYSADPIKLKLNDFEWIYKWFLRWNKIKWVKNIQVVDFHEMVKINGSKEFCDFFNLPPVEFEFKRFKIEFGDNKRKMISNLKDLRSLAKHLDYDTQ